MSENVTDGWVCNCPPGSDPEACFCMYANGTPMAEVTQADFDAILAERDALRGRLDDANAAAARALAAADVERDRFDALREAGDRLAGSLTTFHDVSSAHLRCSPCAALAAWRAATGEGA